MKHHRERREGGLPLTIYIIFGIQVVSNAVVTFIMLRYFL